MNSTTAYVLSKKYVAKTADSLGSLKGAPCTVKSIEDITDASGKEGQKITLQWTGTSDATETRSFSIWNGNDGAYPVSMDINSNNHLIVTLSDDTEIDAGKVPVGEGEGGSAEIEEDITANLSVGNIASGLKIEEGTSLTEFVKKLITKAINPTVSISNNAGTMPKEVGTTLSNVVFTARITNLSSVTEKINSIAFYNGSTLLSSQDFVSGKDSYTYTLSSDVTANTVITARVTYNTNKTVSANSTLSFVYASYYGITNSNSPDANTITALSKRVVSGKGWTWNGIECSDAHITFAYPQSFGALTSIKDANNFEYINSMTRNSITVSGQPYYCYSLTDAVSVSNFKFTFA